ncbi:hypothetical protein OG736_01155 [Streptomyces sp. NBC_01334]|nr:hypothetical protein OG736_01155 [Streptomyces sp. NBC_01334]
MPERELGVAGEGGEGCGPAACAIVGQYTGATLRGDEGLGGQETVEGGALQGGVQAFSGVLAGLYQADHFVIGVGGELQHEG